ncbi:TetR/AcrR family transcriptional regulator [Thaumasiovibrio subtropicus]|uniref:TetR/AcrR family transcriptional regulator n=1 Tax=Thaumasiovibrio subtropicus TaxID=1891207 RepID=UPI000B363E96|nr:TetR/AcrR family transcriptional regulator [Thaumasiovibrio subtropicus]
MNSAKKTRSQLKREAILAAAKTAFKADGVQSTSMDKLAQLAQVSKRTVYNHFATKEVLVMELVSELWTKALVEIDFEYKPETSLHTQLAALLKLEINLIASAEYLDLSRVAFGHLFYAPEQLEAQLSRFAKQETTIHRWLEAAVADGKVMLEDIEVGNEQLHSLIKGRCFWPQLLSMRPILTASEIDTLATQTAAFFLSHYQAKSPD